ncbi:hypothetical protein EDC14_103917 [Hydrogenispora ethanolica]|uniref:Uncharacterized protein n=1 Tax=Hydrogenispora ethanolica TaxID=1082276 RepID=A0A4R1R1Q8_HYDET|nr:hypothetical protein EDC14_103917 [Hydrogenispora ethanolica]
MGFSRDNAYSVGVNTGYLTLTAGYRMQHFILCQLQ